ncbi:hypothetical protein NP493_188g00021 [Ridgeia piscesae]|uniref:Uncharacterized protein n=1 Tax=Ridgeia piscesae TaxID=27915 RepID=A0AAD9P278_RIDPI|nr:hypothetical protein NP493_188g00021 [Ridgeia piscesae]
MSRAATLTQEEAYALGMQRETWCEVERMKEETFARSGRRHVGWYLASHAFDFTKPAPAAPRCNWTVTGINVHRQSRHFPSQHFKSHLRVV